MDPHCSSDDAARLVLSAARIREGLFGSFQREPDTNAYRLLNGDGDGTPGIHVDAYAGFLLVQVLDAGALPLAAALEAALDGALHPLGIVRKLRYEKQARGRVAGEVTRGQAPPPALLVLENGIPFEVELLGGLHTGLFTDMREEHARLRRLAGGRRVLNTFAYTGAFSVAAALGGAAEVTSVDVVAKVLDRARSNFRLAGVDPDAHRFARMEVLEYLTMARRRGWTFGAIVLDPPTYATFRSGTWSMKTGHSQLVRLALDTLEPDGLLWAAANTEGLSPERIERGILSALDQSGREGTVLAVGGLPPDYPTPASRPETRYLKVHVLRVR